MTYADCCITSPPKSRRRRRRCSLSSLFVVIVVRRRRCSSSSSFDAAAFVDWVCRAEVQMPRAGVFVTVAGALFVFLFFCLVAVSARGSFPLPVPPQGATIIDNE